MAPLRFFIKKPTLPNPYKLVFGKLPVKIIFCKWKKEQSFL